MNSNQEMRQNYFFKKVVNMCKKGVISTLALYTYINITLNLYLSGLGLGAAIFKGHIKHA